jgi:hypothetical protein
MAPMMQPIQSIHKICRWGRRRGSVGTGSKGIPVGYLYIRAFQRSVGKRKNSGPVGRNKTRWYQGAFYSGYKKEARA